MLKIFSALFLLIFIATTFSLEPCSFILSPPEISADTAFFSLIPTYNGANFDGLDDYIRIPDAPSLNFGASGDLTIEAWVKLRQFGRWNLIAAKIVGAGTTFNGYQLWTDPANKVKGTICDSVSLPITISNSTITDTFWHYVAYTADRDGVGKIYIDGALNGTPVSVSSVGNIDVDTALWLGRCTHDPSLTLSGALAEVRISNVVRGVDEIQQAYLADGYFEVDSHTIALYHLDENTGTDVSDAAGDNDGTAIGSFIYEHAISLDGVDDHIRVPNSAGLNFGASGDLTIEAWVKLRQFGRWNLIAAKIVGAGTTFKGYQLWTDPANKVKGTICDSVSLPITISNSTITDTFWHYVAYTADRDGMGKIYIDGVQNGSPVSISSVGNIDVDTALWLGRCTHDPSLALSGALGEVKISNIVKTAEQISVSYLLGGIFVADSHTIALWHINENSGTVIYDSACGHNGTAISGYTSAPAVGFDGVDDRIRVPSASDLNFGANKDFSIEAWIKLNAYSRQNMIAAKITNAGSAYKGYQFWVSSDNKLKGCIGDNSSLPIVASTALLNNSAWHYVAFTADRDGMEKLYIDGVQNGSPVSISSVGNIDVDTALWLGRCTYNTSYTLLGSIAEMRISKVARTASEISASYSLGGGFALDTNTVALWHLNENTGTSVSDTALSHTGTMVGGASWVSGYPMIPIYSSSWTNGPVRFPQPIEWFTHPSLTYSWDFESDSVWDTTTTDTAISHRYEEADTYWARVKATSDGCEKQDSTEIQIIGGAVPLPEHNVNTCAFKINYTPYGSRICFNTVPTFTGLQFDGIDDYTIFPNSPDLNFGSTQDFSIEVWFQLQQLNIENPIISKIVENDSHIVGYELWVGSDNRIRGCISDTASEKIVVSNSAVNDSDWHYAVFAADRNGVEKIYLDGVEDCVPVDISSIGSISNDTALWIGKSTYNPSLAFNGSIFEARISNVALTPAQVESTYLANLTNAYFEKDTHTIALWHFNEGSDFDIGDAADDHIGKISTAQLYEPALFFDGENIVDVMNDATLNFGNADDFTIEAWIKLSAFNRPNSIIITKNDYTELSEYTEILGYRLLISGDNKLVCILGDSTHEITIVSDSVFADTNWHYVAFTANRDGLGKLYIDGAANGAAIDISSLGNIDNEMDLIIGGGEFIGEGSFFGTIAEVALTRAVLSADEIDSSYALGGIFEFNDNSVALWHINENNGTTIFDYANYNDGYSYHLQAEAAVVFDGIDDYISVPNSAMLNFGADTDFSIEAWVKLSELSRQNPIVSKINGDSSEFVGYQLAIASDNKVVGNIGGSSSAIAVVSNQQITDTNWHYVAFVADRDSVGQIYIDGIADGSPIDISAVGNSSNSKALWLGRDTRTPHEAFSGTIAEIQISNVARSADEIAESYGWGGVFEGYLGVVALWSLNEGSGNTAIDVSYSGGNNGQLQNGASWGTGLWKYFSDGAAWGNGVIAVPPGEHWQWGEGVGRYPDPPLWIVHPELFYSWDFDGNGTYDTTNASSEIWHFYNAIDTFWAKVRSNFLSYCEDVESIDVAITHGFTLELVSEIDLDSVDYIDYQTMQFDTFGGETLIFAKVDDEIVNIHLDGSVDTIMTKHTPHMVENRYVNRSGLESNMKHNPYFGFPDSGIVSVYNWKGNLINTFVISSDSTIYCDYFGEAVVNRTGDAITAPAVFTHRDSSFRQMDQFTYIWFPDSTPVKIEYDTSLTIHEILSCVDGGFLFTFDRFGRTDTIPSYFEQRKFDRHGNLIFIIPELRLTYPLHNNGYLGMRYGTIYWKTEYDSLGNLIDGISEIPPNLEPLTFSVNFDISENERYAMWSNGRGTLCLYDLDDMAQKYCLEITSPCSILCMDFLPNMNYGMLVLGCPDDSLYSGFSGGVLELNTGNCYPLLYNRNLFLLEIGPNGFIYCNTLPENRHFIYRLIWR